MHEIRLTTIRDDRELTLAVLQIGQMLGFYNAEIARILGIKCREIGLLNEMKQFISTDSATGGKARAFIRFYELLFDFRNGDEAAMHNWLRRDNSSLNRQPFLMLVDEGRIDELIRYLEAATGG
jgi:hypothetical protein